MNPQLVEKLEVGGEQITYFVLVVLIYNVGLFLSSSRSYRHYNA